MGRSLTRWPTARLALAALAAGSISLAEQASARASIPCRPGPGTATIAHSSRARIFSDERNGNDYACLYSNGHPRYLSSTEHYEYLHVRFAGPYVAFEPTIEAVPSNVGVMNMRTGRVHTYEAARPFENGTCSEVNSLVLKGDGAVAWIATDFPEQLCPHPPATTLEVRSHDRHGLHVLDSGTGIAPTSLRLHRARLSWVDGGSTRTATLH
jgi:hypothetical protein